MPTEIRAPAEQPRLTVKLSQTQAVWADVLRTVPHSRGAAYHLAEGVLQLEDLIAAADAYLISGGAKIESDELCRQLDRARGIVAQVFGALA